jgi:putative MATE family efflux protein
MGVVKKENPITLIKKLPHYFFQAISGKEQDYTSGSLNKALFLLSIPMILEMVMESLFAVVDVFFVSKLGNEAVATVGLTESMMMILYSVAMGLSMATTALVARRIGEKDPDKAAEAAGQAFLISLGFSIGFAVFGLIFTEDLLRLMGGSENLIQEGGNYTRWMIGGNITIMLLFLFNAIFRGAGDAFIAMVVLVIANSLNIILDPVFIFGFGPIPAFGVEGAAIATNIGRGIAVLIQLYILGRGSSTIRIAFMKLTLIPSLILKILNLSIGGVGQFLISTASWIFLVRIISLFGEEAIAGYTISIRVIIFTILPSWGLANAAATLVGQNLGANLPERAEKSVWRAAFLNMLFLTGLSIIFFLGADKIVGLFTEDPEVALYGVQCLKYICLGYIFFSYGMVISQAFNGAGDTKTPTIINFVCEWLVQIPLAYFLAVTLELGPTGVFLAISAAACLVALICILVFRKGHWKKIKV